jgi:hypothetical protein
MLQNLFEVGAATWMHIWARHIIDDYYLYLFAWNREV